MPGPAREKRNCPRCGNPTSDLLRIDAGMRLALQTTEEGQSTDIPADVCPNCYQTLSGKVSKGVALRMEEQAKAKNRQMMWKSRVGLVRRARQLMEVKAFSEAAVTYEKYIRVLEVTHDLEKGKLSPDIFGKSDRSKELTVITSVFLDLLRIYDTSPAYRTRMEDAAKKLALFAPFSPIYPDVVRKAEIFARSAKHPEIVKSFLKQSRKNRPRCFIATAAFGYPMAPEVIYLREFRDQILRPHPVGRRLIYYYYKLSPKLAQKLVQKPTLRRFTRRLLQLVVGVLKKLS